MRWSKYSAEGLWEAVAMRDALGFCCDDEFQLSQSVVSLFTIRARLDK